MLSRKDTAIQENILKPKTVQTFLNQVHIRKSDDAIVADSLEEFMNKITDPCHLWEGPIDADGYGLFTVYSIALTKRYTVLSHRFAYALAYGFDALKSEEKNVLNHLCFTRNCVNPLHLESITPSQNNSKEKRKPLNV